MKLHRFAWLGLALLVVARKWGCSRKSGTERPERHAEFPRALRRPGDHCRAFPLRPLFPPEARIPIPNAGETNPAENRPGPARASPFAVLKTGRRRSSGRAGKSRRDCKPRANNRLFQGEKGVMRGWCRRGKPLAQLGRFAGSKSPSHKSGPKQEQYARGHRPHTGASSRIPVSPCQRQSAIPMEGLG